MVRSEASKPCMLAEILPVDFNVSCQAQWELRQRQQEAYTHPVNNIYVTLGSRHATAILFRALIGETWLHNHATDFRPGHTEPQQCLYRLLLRTRCDLNTSRTRWHCFSLSGSDILSFERHSLPYPCPLPYAKITHIGEPTRQTAYWRVRITQNHLATWKGWVPLGK